MVFRQVSVSGSTVTVSSSAATPQSKWRGRTSTGGLVGVNDDRVAAGYATGRVSGSHRVGGLWDLMELRRAVTALEGTPVRTGP